MNKFEKCPIKSQIFRKEMEKARLKNMKYDFSYYMMICKTFLMKSAGVKKDLFFSNSEEELFQKVNMIVPTI